MLVLKKRDKEKQESLMPLSEDERQSLRKDLSELVAEFIVIEEQKAEANADFTDRLNATWKSIAEIEAKLRD